MGGEFSGEPGPMIAFRYYGGKNAHLSWLLPLLPNDDSVDHYVEPYAGSLAVLLNRKKAPCETVNDVHDRVVNFFKVLRTEKLRLIRAVNATPYAETEFYRAVEPSSDEFEDARRFSICLSFGMGYGIGKSQSFRIQTNSPQYSSPSRAARNRTKDWMQVIERILDCQITCRPALDLLQIIDAKGVLIYLDPTYLPETRNAVSYTHEMTRKDHVRLLSEISRPDRKSRIAISGYGSSLYDRFLFRKGWIKHEQSVRCMVAKDKKERTEVVWMNYDPVLQDLFAEAR